jgi:hypothetical protein
MQPGHLRSGAGVEGPCAPIADPPALAPERGGSTPSGHSARRSIKVL